MNWSLEYVRSLAVQDYHLVVATLNTLDQVDQEFERRRLRSDKP